MEVQTDEQSHELPAFRLMPSFNILKPRPFKPPVIRPLCSPPAGLSEEGPLQCFIFLRHEEAPGAEGARSQRGLFCGPVHGGSFRCAKWVFVGGVGRGAKRCEAGDSCCRMKPQVHAVMVHAVDSFSSC